MTVAQAIIAYCVAAGLLTITPGLDTALVLRTAAVEGARNAARAGFGIVTGCLAWGCAVAAGLGALLTASQLAFTALKWAGAVYLVWLGAHLLLKPRSKFDIAAARVDRYASGRNGFRRGLLTNLLNPKVGVFYVSFLPQFLPAHVRAAPFIVLLAGLHALMGIVWFAVLILSTRRIANALRRPRLVATLDRLTGLVFVAFGLRLALARR